MGNVVEIRVTSQNQARPGLVDARKDFDDLKKTGVSAGDAVGRSMQQMADKVTAAQTRLSRAHEAERDALAKVVSASNDLDFERIGGDTDKMAAATKRLDDALAKVAKTERDVSSASKLLAKAQSEFAKAGDEAGSQFARGASSKLARLGPGLGAAAIPAATLAGAAISEGLVLGFGLGLSGVGIAAASQFGQVKDEFAQLKSEVAAESKTIFAPFGQTLLDVRAQAGGLFDFFTGALTKASAELAPKLSHFTGMLATSLKKFEPAIEPLTRASGRVLDAFGNRMPGVMTKLERGFHSLADSIDENPEALGDLVDGAASATEAMLKFFAVLNKGYGPVREGIGWLANLSDKIQDLSGSPGPRWHKNLAEVPPAAQGATDALDATAKSAEELAAAQKAAEEAAQRHAEALRDLTVAAYGQLSAELALRDAVDAGDDAIKDYNEAVRDHGRKSEEASDALRALEQSSLRVAEAARDNALAQQQAAGKATDLVSANQAAVGALRAMASEARGPARDAILAQVAALDALIARLRSVPGTYAAKVQVTVSQTGHYSGPPLGALPRFAHGGITGAAGGGPRAGRTLVGEDGPEIVDLAPGSMVHPAGETQRMLSQDGEWQGPPIYELRVTGNRLIELLVEELQREIRNRGGLGRVFVA